MDIRDLVYDVTHFKWNWKCLGMLVIDVVALLPVIGAIKYSDEVVKLTKRWTKNLDGKIEIAVDAVTGFGKKLKGIFDSGVKKVSSATKAILTETKVTEGTKKAKEILNDLSKKIFKGGSKTINTLTDAQKSRLNALENTINDHLTNGDFSGTLRDLQGNPVPNGKGGYFDHLGEMKDSYKALQKTKRGLEGSLKNPNLSVIDKALLQEGLDKANSYISKIEELFNPYGGID